MARALPQSPVLPPGGHLLAPCHPLCLRPVQLVVESYFGFDGTNRLGTTYWIGLERVSSVSNSQYAWLDGTEIGNGYVSNVVRAHATCPLLLRAAGAPLHLVKLLGIAVLLPCSCYAAGSTLPQGPQGDRAVCGSAG
jgi:hypothetical protein